MLKNSKLTLIALGSAVLLTLAVFIFALRYLENKNEKILSQNEEVNELLVEKSLAESLTTLEKTSGPELQAFEALVLTEQGLVPLIEDLEGKGRNLGLDLEVVSVDKEKSESLPEGVEILKIAIKAQGSWSSTYALLKSIESLPHLVTFDKVNFHKEGGSWNLEVAFSTHIFKENKGND